MSRGQSGAARRSNERSDRARAGESMRVLARGVDRQGDRSPPREWIHWLDRSPDGVVVVDASGCVRFVNQAALRLFGASREELTSESLAFCSEAGVTTELRISSDEGPRFAELRLEELTWEGEPCQLASFRDVTERKNLEAQLLAADRMTSIGTLVASVAHEINNPLVALCANLELSSRALAEVEEDAVPDEVHEELDDARAATECIRTIVGDLQALCRHDEAECGPVDVHAVIDSALRFAASQIQRRARLVRRHGTPPLALAEAGRLGQVLLNLLVNAAQAIPEGNAADNQVTVETGTDAQGRVSIAVADTGSGMSEEVRARVFTPFFTTKPVGVGTGLGLSICERIVRSFGGELSFETREGEGTTFRVSLPPARFDGELPPPPEASSSTGPAPARVLVVDDEALIRRLVRRTLRDACDVVEAESSVQALELVRSGEQFDVVLCELAMPVLNGPDLYRAVRQVDGFDPASVVFMTANGFDSSNRAFLGSVPNDRIEKPFDAQALRALVARRIDGRARARKPG